MEEVNVQTRVNSSEEETKTNSNQNSDSNNAKRTRPRDTTTSSERRREGRGRFDKKKTRLLEEWIRNHEEFTYPSSKDLTRLCDVTGLTEKQIRVWFTNHRNRKNSKAEICLSRIKYSILSKSFQRKSKKAREKHMKNTSKHYLSKYYCVCEDVFDPRTFRKTTALNPNAKKFFESCGYCVCDL